MLLIIWAKGEELALVLASANPMMWYWPWLSPSLNRAAKDGLA